MPVIAQVEECFKRDIQEITYEDDKIYINGVNNDYPTKIDMVINASPTAKMAVNMMAKYIAGKGLTEESQDIIVNSKKQLYLSDNNRKNSPILCLPRRCFYSYILWTRCR